VHYRFEDALASNFGIAVGAVHWPAVSRLERYFGVFATLCADGGIHLPLSRIAVAVTATAVPPTSLLGSLAAFEATLRLIGVALGGEELLL